MNLDENVRTVTVDGNVHLMTVAVRNVLDNALKYSKNDVSVDVNLVESALVLTVTDTGIGIPIQEMAKIGMPLFRAENTAGITGTGLGLALVKRVMEIHHGGLQVFANSPNGLQVILKLPIMN
jgi:signal transduction histidine kinase